MGTFIDLTGQRFGSLTVLYKSENKGNGKKPITKWVCRCACENIVVVDAKSLRSHVTKSCGCLHDSYIRSQHNRETHGGSTERLYRVWRGMKERCYYPKHNRFQDYGGRGIEVCEEWRNDYAAFREWAMKTGYDPTAPRGECTIDRIDVNGPYAPWNCRWANAQKQANNRRH